MSQKFWFHICARQGDDVTNSMSVHGRDLVFEVAKKAGPGATIEAKKRLVERELGYPRGSWRVHAAWYLRAGSWSAQAMHDLQERVRRWREAEARKTTSAAEAERARQMVLDRKLLGELRAKHLAELARIEARMMVLTGDDA